MTEKEKEKLIDEVQSAISGWSYDNEIDDLHIRLEVVIEDGWTKVEVI